MTSQIDYQSTKIKQRDIDHSHQKSDCSIDIDELLRMMLEFRASDLHIKSPTGPIYRVDGQLVKNELCHPVTPEDVEVVFRKITTDEQKEQFAQCNELDFAYSIPGVARYRVNVHRQRGTLSIVFRIIPFHIPTIDELGLPKICKDLMMRPRGLIVVTGPTGSGKSTTLAAMIQHRNLNSRNRIITIEDPVEYIFKDEQCVISQREIGADTDSFPLALRHALRHDPDVIIVGEMRDLETMSTAVSAAETGHLVLGTLHTIDAPQTVDRLIDMYPAAQQGQMRLQFSQLLVAVICQTLVPRASGRGRVGAFEIMTANTAVKNIIREGRTQELTGTIQLGTTYGMQTLDQDLARLIRERIIISEEALLKSSTPERLTKLIDNTWK